MLIWNFINSYYLLSKYTVLFCIVCTVKGICVLSLVLGIFYSWCIGQGTAFLCCRCFCGLCHNHAVVLLYRITRITYQIHTVKRKHCCAAFKFILVFQVKFLNLHPLFSMTWYLPYTQRILPQQLFSGFLFKLFHLW